jgi:hypothetical protein
MRHSPQPYLRAEAKYKVETAVVAADLSSTDPKMYLDIAASINKLGKIGVLGTHNTALACVVGRACRACRALWSAYLGS